MSQFGERFWKRFNKAERELRVLDGMTGIWAMEALFTLLFGSLVIMGGGIYWGGGIHGVPRWRPAGLVPATWVLGGFLLLGLARAFFGKPFLRDHFPLTKRAFWAGVHAAVTAAQYAAFWFIGPDDDSWWW